MAEPLHLLRIDLDTGARVRRGRAQGLPRRQAIEGAVWLHGAAANRCAQAGIGPIGLTASELSSQVRTLRNICINGHKEGETLKISL